MNKRFFNYWRGLVSVMMLIILIAGIHAILNKDYVGGGTLLATLLPLVINDLYSKVKEQEEMQNNPTRWFGVVEGSDYAHYVPEDKYTTTQAPCGQQLIKAVWVLSGTKKAPEKCPICLAKMNHEGQDEQE